MLVFVMGALISLSTGSSYGTFAILMAIAVPVGYQLDASMYLTIAAVLSGGLFGDHCSPISDTTVLASVGADCPHLNHVTTQGAYAGLTGAVTNGAMRDLDSLEPDFPVIAGSIGVSHAFVHVREIGTPVRILGLRIAQGDLVHADRHGALVVPQDVYTTLPDAIATLHDCESLIVDAAREPGFDIDALEQAWTAFETARV